MNLNIYEKTRYQNIYRNKKNKNYIVKINTPVDSTISIINGEKIFKLEEALKIRDNSKNKILKEKETKFKDDFDSVWEKYIYSCRYEMKLSYNTWHKKIILYNAFFKGKFNKPLTKISKDFLIKIIENFKTTDKEKNELIKTLRAFFNWCQKEEYILYNPMQSISFFKVTKSKMKYWQAEEIKKFFSCINKYIETNVDKEKAYCIKILVLLGFVLGNRIGETRALTFGSIDEDKLTINILHSINYDPKSKDFLSSTKNYWSQREINISNKIVNELENYKLYLRSLGYNITNDTLIFFNHHINKPITDKILRKNFYKYCELANVTKIRLYDLRHTYVATMMNEGKELYLISERLGHTSYSTTVNKYGHLSNKIRKEMAEITDVFFE
mgnify:CR=1 FL=1